MKFKDYITEKVFDHDEEFLSMWNILKKDCKPFIKELKSTHMDEFFYRGLNKKFQDFEKIVTRKNREPKDTPKHIHVIIDNYFKKKFGWKARSEGVFTTSDDYDAAGYGQVVIIFPIGKYKYLWSPVVEDLYTKIRDEIGIYDAGDFSKSEWADEYGRGGKGQWYYDGKKTGKKDYLDAIKYVVKNKFKGVKGLFEDNMMIWKPDLTYREWITMNIVKGDEDSKNDIYGILDTYITTNMKEALKSENEVMFSCKSYYAIHNHYNDELTDAVYRNKLPEK